jgi:hypothetical protein
MWTDICENCVPFPKSMAQILVATSIIKLTFVKVSLYCSVTRSRNMYLELMTVRTDLADSPRTIAFLSTGSLFGFRGFLRLDAQVLVLSPKVQNHVRGVALLTHLRKFKVRKFVEIRNNNEDISVREDRKES